MYLVDCFILTLSFPIFIFGFVSNFIPSNLTGIITDNVKIRADFVGAVKIAVGLFVFTICYSIEAFVFA